MVGKDKETVGFDEKTEAFIKAFNYVKKAKRMQLKEIAVSIGMTKETNDMIRAGRRMAHDDEIQTLVKIHPETSQFFQNALMLNEPAAPTYGKMIEETLSSKDAALEAQKKTIAMQEEMIRILKDEIDALRREIDKKLK